MKNPEIISIDLGSAYTKIGVRRSWDDTAVLVRGMPVALRDEEDFCIPSVVARVESPRGSRWLIGADAASQRPAQSVKVFRNWKAALFGSGTARSSAGHELGIDEAIGVAIAFFTELRSSLLMKLPADSRGWPVRVAVPSLGGSADMDTLILDLLQQAGWNGADGRTTVFEPESNALGFLSRGRNATWTPRQQSFRPRPELTIQMQRMLEPGLSSAFRRMAKCYAVLVSDVGAFTTDFGYVEFDTSFWTDDWNRPKIVQESVELGITQLDDCVLGLLPRDVQAYFANGQPAEWDRRKKQLYAGKEQRLVIAGKSVTLGGDDQAMAIQKQVASFAKRVCDERDRFLQRNELTIVHEEAVTGGGSAIAALRTRLLERIRTERRRVHDLWDPKEPDVAVAAGAGRMSADQRDRRLAENRLLIRGGSALGGASVFFE